MVLDFGLLRSGLFPESELSGEGMGSDPQQVVIKTGSFVSVKLGADSNTVDIDVPVGYTIYEMDIMCSLVAGTGVESVAFRVNNLSDSAYNSIFSKQTNATWAATTLGGTYFNACRMLSEVGNVIISKTTIVLSTGLGLSSREITMFSHASQRTGTDDFFEHISGTYTTATVSAINTINLSCDAFAGSTSMFKAGSLFTVRGVA